MSLENKNYEFKYSFLDNIKQTFLTGSFAFTSYTSPNTTMEVSNDIFDIMLNMKPNELKVWLKACSMLKRNHEPTVACSVFITKEDCSMSKSTFYDATSRLMKKELLIKTLKRSEYIVNPKYAHKLFKPKCDFELPNNL